MYLPLEKQPWMRYSQGLAIEMEQAGEEGRELGALPQRVLEIAEMPEGLAKEEAAAKVYAAVQAAPIRPDFAYNEPEAYRDILAACAPEQRGQMPAKFSLENAVLGGWQGRIAGCMLGAPIEGWKKARIQGFMQDTGNWPVRNYLRSDVADEIRTRYEVEDAPGNYGNLQKPWLNLLPDFAPEDDDINYTVMALLAVETFGRDFLAAQMGSLWLETLPPLLTCTAERVVCRSLMNSVLPPDTASHCNPYREWIGAQIRTDLYGYISPGNPREAARLAYSDASLSHTKNGVYGAMWAAAMVALAFGATDLAQLLADSLREIPLQSRLHKSVSQVLDMRRAGESAETVFAHIHSLYDEYTEHGWCHTIPNAMIVAAALLYGKADFAETIGLAVYYGFDTDCNAATAGSVLGVMLGADNLPELWKKPFNGRVKTGLHGMAHVDIEELARRSVALVR